MSHKIPIQLNVVSESSELTLAIASELEKEDMDEEKFKQLINNEHTTDTRPVQADSTPV